VLLKKRKTFRNRYVYLLFKNNFKTFIEFEYEILILDEIKALK